MGLDRSILPIGVHRFEAFVVTTAAHTFAGLGEFTVYYQQVSDLMRGIPGAFVAS